MRLLRSLASHKGRTIAASIHQPSSLLYALFDQLMLLASGRVVYCGPAEAAVKYMSDMGTWARNEGGSGIEGKQKGRTQREKHRNGWGIS
jgi:ABC-type multidrug transport system ATPase subunit